MAIGWLSGDSPDLREWRSEGFELPPPQIRSLMLYCRRSASIIPCSSGPNEQQHYPESPMLRAGRKVRRRPLWLRLQD
jgi:hypothetical protein